MTTLTLLFDWLVTASLRASLLTVAVLLLQVVLRKHLTPRMRYALWLPLLVALVMPVFPQSRWSVETIFAAAPQSALITDSSEWMTSNPSHDFSPLTPAPEPIDWRILLGISWLVGVCGVLLFGLFSLYITLHRIKRSRQVVRDGLGTTLAQIAHEIGLSYVPRVWTSTTIHSPAVTGLLRPTLLLPEHFDRAFTPAEVRLILKHELMHLKRHDLPLNALLCLLMALHWFNPLLWFAFFKIRLDREAACDAQVLQNDSDEQRREYGQALLKVETAFCPRGLSLGFVGIFQRGTTLRSRICSIVTHHQPHPIMKPALAITLALLGFFGITTAAPPSKDAPRVKITTRIIEFSESNARTQAFDYLTKGPGGSSITTTLSDAELKRIMKELSLTKDVDLMTAPSVTARSGEEATIEITREFAYEDESCQAATKTLGVIITTLPTFSNEAGHAIDLTLSAQIVEVAGMVKTSSGTERPIFSDQKAKVITAVYDGATIVFAMPGTTAIDPTTQKEVASSMPRLVFATTDLLEK